jgi:hypothetical protein
VIYGPPAECNSRGFGECNTLLHSAYTRAALIIKDQKSHLNLNGGVARSYQNRRIWGEAREATKHVHLMWMEDVLCVLFVIRGKSGGCKIFTIAVNRQVLSRGVTSHAANLGGWPNS